MSQQNSQEATTNVTRQQTRPIRVLLLDAHPVQPKIISVALGREGCPEPPYEYKPAWGDIGVFASFYRKYDVIAYTNPAAALQRLLDPQNIMPDLLILDTQVPHIDWPQIVRSCRETPHLQHLPIILIVQLDGRPGTLLKVRFSGAAGRLERPVTVEKILDEVLRVEQTLLQNTDIWSR